MENTGIPAPSCDQAMRKTAHAHFTSPLTQADTQGLPPLPFFAVLGVQVHAVEMHEAIKRLRQWIDAPFSKTHFVAVVAMHPVAEARQNEQYRQILNSADLAVPDGMPLVWLARINGYALKDRLCGSELMETFCRVTGNAYRHFFYGGTPSVAIKLAETLREKYGIAIAGTYAPPFRALTAAEEQEVSSLVEKTAPDVLWVGLSSPKQEKWIDQHRPKLKVPVMLAVGAAFDMNSGAVKRAPGWIRRAGLEWLYRLSSEPRRLWKRYLITIPNAMCCVGLELLGFRMVLSQGGSKAPADGRK